MFVTLAVGAGCLLGAASLAAQPAHLVKGHPLVDELVAAQSLGAFTGVVDGATVFLNRDGGSWNPPGPLSFSRFLDANRDANVGPYAANLPECAPLVTHRLKTTCNWNWSQNLTPIRSIRAPSGPRRAPAPTSLFPRSSIRSASPPT